MSIQTNKHQSGFTIIELMIAISVLSVVLLITTIGIVRIGEAYYKGIAQANTQQAARNILNDVAENIKYSGIDGSNTPAAPLDIPLIYGAGNYQVNTLCLGNQRYNYVMNYRLDTTTQVSATDPTSKHVLWEDTMPNATCAALDIGKATPAGVALPPSTPGTNGRELVGQNMRLTNFSVEKLAGSDTLYTISVTVMYGADDLIDRSDPGGMPNWKCKSEGGLIGASFCAKSELTTIVGKRLR